MKDATPRPARPTGRPRRTADQHLDSVECPRCGRSMAKIIGRSEFWPVLYLRCAGCHLTSVARG